MQLRPHNRVKGFYVVLHQVFIAPHRQKMDKQGVVAALVYFIFQQQNA